MKHTFLLSFVLLFALGCNRPSRLCVEFTNSLAFDRENETVYLPWSDVVEAVDGVTPKTVVVVDSKGNQVASQVDLTEGGAGQLIFQVSVGGSAKAEYKVMKGERESYAANVGGRYVPERMDDYAWENNVVAFRIYGKALEQELVSPGVDVWCKTGGKLVIDEWYKLNDYHHNHGEGMDCYKVGVSLGCGASVPLINDTLAMPRNWAEYDNLTSGAVSKSFVLKYEPFAVGEGSATLTKLIVVDANTNFYNVADIYSGSGFDVAAGIVRHEVKQFVMGENWFAMVEPASDSDDKERDGDIYLAMIMNQTSSADMEIVENGVGGHSLFIIRKGDNPVVEYTVGTAWSGGNVESFEQWSTMVARKAAQTGSPLTFEYK